MLQTLSKNLAALGALVLVFGLAGPADANDDRHGGKRYWNQQQSSKQGPTAGAFAHGSPGYNGQIYRRYNDPRQQPGRTGHYKTHGHKKHGHYQGGHDYGYRKHHKPQGKAYGYYGRYPAQSCQRVYKHGYWHGRPAKIGGLRCYDGYGRAYIKPGSHHVLRYYAPGYVFAGPNFSFYWR